LIVQTTRFKAAVEDAGPSNLVSYYSQLRKSGVTNYYIGLTEAGQGAGGGTPWQFRDHYIENSPFFFLDRVKTPLLIIAGALDTTVPPEQGEEVFVGLRRLGTEVTYVEYADEGHVITKPANLIDYWTRIVSWFDTHLK